MINGKIIGIDARMIEMSGIGTYIQHLMAQGIYDVAIGDEKVIRRYDKTVNVVQFDAPIYGLKEQLRYPNTLIRETGVNIMHFPHYNVPISYKGDYVVTVHDLTHLVFPQFLGNRIKYFYAKFIMANALKRAKHVFTVSEYSKKDIIRFFNVPSKKISITNNAVDEDFRVKNLHEIAYLYDKFSISKGKKLMLYVGNLKPHKNLESLLKSFQMINRTRNDVELILVGKAFKGVNLLKWEENLGIAEKVIHTGLVSKQELVDLYNLADLFIFPSLYEGFGIPPLEAMACGTPVIAADNSSIPEVCGNAAMLVDAKNIKMLSDTIVETIDNDYLKKELINKGFEQSKSFCWDTAVRTVKSELNKLTGKTGIANERSIY